jgi:hypothetical protein
MRRFNFGSKRQFKTNAILLIVALLVVSYLLLTVGFKFLLNSSVFFADLFSKETPAPLNKTTDVYGSVNIDDIPVATNSASIVISGSVVNYSTVNFYINGKKIKETELVAADTFSEEIGDLKEGNNDVYVRAETSDGKNSKKSATYSVLYKPQKPKLEISEPTDRATVNDPEVTVKGKTDKEIFIRVNGSPIVVNAQGDFDSTVRLKEGENAIIIQASDIAGNLETKTLTVIYQKED